MTLGEKIKAARTENGFTQEQLAEKLMVSRQAVTKWEADKGIPDISNLKMLSQLLNVSVDYLLDDGMTADMNVIRESVDSSQYGKSTIKKSLTDKLMRDKFPKAEIYTLLPKKKLDKTDKGIDFIVDFFTPLCGMSDIRNSLKLLGTEYYLVNDGNRQFFVIVNYKEGFMESRRTAQLYGTQKGSKFTVEDIVFTVGCEISR